MSDLGAMNLTNPKNLDVLRSEYDKLGTRVARLAFIRATLLLIFIFSLAAAFQTISSRDASGIVDRIKKVMVITREAPDLDGFLSTIYFPTSLAQTDAPHPETSDTEPYVPPTDADLAKAQQEEDELAHKLTTISNEAFTFVFKAPLLGTEVKLDLRIWAFVLLLCFIFWEVHLSILRHKLRTLQRVGSVMVTRAPGDATVLDQLVFSWDGLRPAAFSRHPAQFELIASLIGGLGLIAYLCFEGRDFWRGAAPSAKHQLIEIYGFVIVYAFGYATYVKHRINADARRIDGFKPVINFPGRLIAIVVSGLRTYARQLWPEVNLVTGSALVLGTLLLLVGAPFGCEPRTGWGYLHHPNGWLVGPVCGYGAGFDMFATGAKKGWSDADRDNLLIVILYAAGLAIAAFTVLLLFVSLLRRRRLGRETVTLCLATASTALALFFLTELAVGQLLDFIPNRLLPFGLLLWVIPMWTWWRYARSKRAAGQVDWPRVPKSLFYWYLPQAGVAIIVAIGTCFENDPLVGVPVFVCGLAILALGYWNTSALGDRERGDRRRI